MDALISRRRAGQYLAAPGAEPQRLAAGEAPSASWSPDGRILLFDGDGVFYAAYAPDFTPRAHRGRAVG